MCIHGCDSIIDSLCKWIGTGLHGFHCNLAIELGFGLFGLMFVVSAGFKTIWVDLFRFCWNLIIFYWSESILYDFNDLADWRGLDRFGNIR